MIRLNLLQFKAAGGLLILLCVLSVPQFLTAQQCQSISISAQDYTICKDHSVVLAAKGVPVGSDYSWSLGPWKINNNQDSVRFAAAKSGVFSATLNIKTPSNLSCLIKLKQDITVVGRPDTLDFEISTGNRICELPKEVTINATGGQKDFTYTYIIETLGNSSLDYQFRGKSSESSVTHRFRHPGYKKVILEIENASGCKTLIARDSLILAANLEEPIFLFDDPGTCDEKEIDFSVKNGVESGLEYHWKFQNASPPTSKIPEPRKVKFDKPGSYDVSLEVSNGNGCKVEYKLPSAVQVGTEVLFDIDISRSEICHGDEIVLTQTGADLRNGAISWKLGTGDIDEARSTDKVKRVFFLDPGYHNLGLTYSYGGCITRVNHKRAVLTHKVKSSFSAPAYCDCKPGSMTFKNESFSSDPSATLKYFWVVTKEGSVIHTDTNKDLTYDFSAYNDYKVQLTVESSNGCRNISKRNVHFAPLEAEFDVSRKSACLGETVSAAINKEITCLTSVQSIEWTLYDQDNRVVTQSNKQGFKYTFSKPGLYSLGLAVKTSNGCTDEIIKTAAIDVYQVQSTVIADKEFLCINDSVEVKVAKGPYKTLTMDKWLIIDPITKARNTGSGSALKFPISRPGTYDIQLTSTLNSQCADTVVLKGAFKVGGVEAEISSSIKESCLPFNSELSVKVNKNTHHINPSNQLLYRWSILDSTFSQLTSPNASSTKVSINSSGSYDIQLKITNSDGCETIAEKKEALLVGVKARFGANDVACLNVPFAVKNRSFLNPISHQWVVSDTSIKVKPKSTVEAPNFIFTETGTYSISLITKNQQGCVDTATRKVEVIDFDFSFSSEQAENVLCAPSFVTFKVKQTNVDSFYWDFGDGKGLGIASNKAAHLYDILDQDPNNEYAFDVSLIAFSNQGCSDTLTRAEYITLAGPRPKFVADPLIGTEVLDVDFFDLNQGVSHYLFHYGDNSSIDSNEMNTHTYMIQDSTKLFEEYYPKMVAFDPRGCKRSFLGEPIRVYNKAIARFSVDTLEACDSVTISLKNYSAFADSFAWYLNNDAIAFSSDREPQVQLPAGTHTITLEALNLAGVSHRETKKDYIIVHQKPTVSIELSQTFLCTQKEVRFNDISASDNDITYWLWDFDPKNPGKETAQIKNPVKTYTDKGSYSISLVVSDAFGCANNKLFIDTITVGEPTAILHQGLSFVSFESENVLSTHITESDIAGTHGFLIYENIDGEERALQALNEPMDSTLEPGEYQFRLRNNQATYQLKGINECADTVAIGSAHYPIFINIDTSNNFLPRLNWNAYEGWNEVAHYEVLKAEYGGNLQIIATLSPKQTSYTDSQVCGTKYEYFVRALASKTGYTSRSKTDTIRPNYVAPKGQTELLYTTVVDNKYILTTWKKDQHPTIGYYSITRNDPNFGYVSQHASVTDTFYLDSIEVFTDKDIYSYQIQAVDFCKNSTESSIQGNSIVCAVQRSEEHADIEWNLFEDWPIEKTTYSLQRSEGDDDFVTIFEGTGIKKYRDQDIFTTEDDIFHYRVKAVFGEYMVYSNAVREFPELRVFVPNAFSPNNDGINDEFLVYGSGGQNGQDENVDNFKMTILNRWGEIIYNSHLIDKGWDGQFKGQDSPAGTYVCHIEFRNKKGQFTYHTGNLVLLR